MPKQGRTGRAEVRHRRNGVSEETAAFSKCAAVAEDFMMSHAAYGYTAREVVELAAVEYGAIQWQEYGVILSDGEPDYDKEKATRFLRYMYKLVFGWRRTDMREDGKKNAKFEGFEKNKGTRDKVLGLWVGNPEARLVELQRVISRNRGRDDKTVVSAIRAAAETPVITGGTGGDNIDSAKRVILDVPDDKRAMFFAHLPKPKA